MAANSKAQKARQASLVAVGLMLGLFFPASPSNAIDLGGTARLWTGPFESNGVRQSQTDQRYTLRLSQALSPWLALEAGFRYTDYSTNFDVGPSLFRSSKEPYLALRYERPVLSARIAALNREIRSSNQTQNLDIRNYLGAMEWRPSWGPIFQLHLEDNLNTADPAVFGRETQARRGDLNILWNRTRWNLAYRFSLSSIDNKITEFRLDDSTHQIRLNFTDYWFRDRWLFSVDGRYAFLEQTVENPTGVSTTQPVPITQGMSSVDTSPETGELAPTPGLIDGDFETPVAPPIDIGGANTFRNLGANLGITRPVTQLEISVDRASSPLLLWEVYVSPDNLNWFPISGATSTWDGGFLRYRIQFPEIETRFIKAVNVSTNGVEDVLVTELRVLVDQGVIDTQSGSTDEYWLNLLNIVQLHRRVELTLISNTRRDAVLRLDGASPGRDTQDYGAKLRFQLLDTLELRLDYRLTELDEALDELQRDTEFGGIALEWRPLQTVDVILSADTREESTNSETIQINDSLLLRARTDLLPGLSLVTDLLHSELQDPILGYDQTTNMWRESLIASPWRTLNIIGNLSYAVFDSTGVVSITHRTIAELGGTWTPNPAISITAFFGWNQDNLYSTLTQRYGLTWSPGKKFSLGLAYRDIETPGARRTSSATGTANYRLNPWVRLWANASQTSSEQSVLDSTETRSARVGLRVIF